MKIQKVAFILYMVSALSFFAGSVVGFVIGKYLIAVLLLAAAGVMLWLGLPFGRKNKK